MAEYKPRTAQDVVGEVGPGSAEAEAKERAEKAGVVHPADVDYAEALKNYESRPDVETLKERLAREQGNEFSDADFRREVGGVDNTGVVTTDTAVKNDDDKKVVEPEAKPARRK